MDQLRNPNREQVVTCGTLPPPFDRWDQERCCLEDHADGRLVDIELPDGRTAIVCSFSHCFVSYVRVHGPDAGNEMLESMQGWNWFRAAAGAGQPTIFKALTAKYGELTLTPEEIMQAQTRTLERSRKADGTVVLSSTPSGFELYKDQPDHINPFGMLGLMFFMLNPEVMLSVADPGWIRTVQQLLVQLLPF